MRCVSGGLVLAVLVGPLLLAPWTRGSNREYILTVEKRPPAEWVQPRTWRDWFSVRYYANLDRVLEEAVPGRSILIILKNLAERNLFGRRRFGAVDLGREGWLFLRDAYVRPEDTPPRVDRVLRQLQAFAARSRGKEAEVIWVLCPEKAVVYPEYLDKDQRWHADRFAWRHRRLREVWEADPSGRLIALWQTYSQAKGQARKPIFYHEDSHHTPRTALLLVEAMVETVQPGIWNEREVVLREIEPKTADLYVMAGLGESWEEEEVWDVERDGVELVSGEWLNDALRFEGGPKLSRRFWLSGTNRYGALLAWQMPARLRTRSRGALLIPGRTAILHDSMLAKSREALRQFFADVTFLHYNDVVAQDSFPELLRTHDRVLVECGERTAIDHVEELLRTMRTEVVSDLAAAPGETVRGGGRMRLSREGRDLVLESDEEDPSLFLSPPPDLPWGDYILRVEQESARTTSAQLFYQTANQPAFTDVQSLFREVREGRNVLYFPLTASRARRPLRYDPGTYAGRYHIRSLDLRRWTERPDDAPGQVPLAGITANTQTRLRSGPEGLEITALSNDPQVFLPRPFSMPVRIGIELWVPNRTLCQVFFLRPGTTEYREEDNRSQEISAGWNTLWFEVPGGPTERPLRLDPGFQPGRYVLKHVRVLPLDPDP